MLLWAGYHFRNLLGENFCTGGFTPVPQGLLPLPRDQAQTASRLPSLAPTIPLAGRDVVPLLREARFSDTTGGIGRFHCRWRLRHFSQIRAALGLHTEARTARAPARTGCLARTQPPFPDSECRWARELRAKVSRDSREDVIVFISGCCTDPHSKGCRHVVMKSQTEKEAPNLQKVTFTNWKTCLQQKSQAEPVWQQQTRSTCHICISHFHEMCPRSEGPPA
ncbi:hypothetical protein NDU88_001749 [Pleurodeles waltl]|uniref:Uncharacterized protein n=1 Tax=Pleurodeles waltl TaxID=8319 RepID=A0AAV7Q6V7_PLEWA|nr:hypothetical protein NDU88_001749 [Pleurodeles waltl]